MQSYIARDIYLIPWKTETFALYLFIQMSNFVQPEIGLIRKYKTLYAIGFSRMIFESRINVCASKFIFEIQKI